MAKCILLIRVSSQNQDLTQQTDKVKAEALKDGFQESDIIILEDKESAVKLSEEERNGLNMMKWHIENDDISCVYAYEVSRISRQPAMLYNIRDYLIEHHVQLIILNPYMKMLKDDGTLSEAANIFFGIFSSMAENEGFLRKSRLARGREKKKKSREHEGGPVVIGYEVDKQGHYIVDEEGAKIVRRIFNEYVNGISINSIAQQLQNEGYKADRTIHSVVNQCFKIIHREFYVGDYKHPSIISKELFERAKMKCDSQRTYFGGSIKTSLLKGILRDGETGYLMSAKYATKQYVCKRKGKISCSMKIADMIVAGVAREWYSSLYSYREDEYVKMINDKISEHERVLSQQEKNITNNQDKIDRIEERYIEGRINKEKADKLEKKAFEDLQKYKRLYEQAKNDIDKLKEELQKDRKMSDDLRTIVLDVIKTVYLYRISRSILKFEIVNSKTGEIRSLEVNSRYGTILKMEINLRQTLNWNGK